MSQPNRFQPHLNSPDEPTPFFRNARRVATAITASLGPLTIRGAENLPPGPCILASNHRAHLDPPYLARISNRQAAFMAKQELFEGFVGWFVRRMGAFPVRRGEPDRSALRTAIELLGRGYMVAIFPEGTRSPDGRLYPAEPGFGLIAKQSGAPIVPIAIEGTERAMPKGAKMLHRAAVTITIGKPFTAAEILEQHPGAKKDALDIIGRETMQRIHDLMIHPVPMADTPAPQDGGARATAHTT